MIKTTESPLTLTFEGKSHHFPVYEGTMGERGLDIQDLRKITGLVTLDPGLGNTGIGASNITFVDGEKGILTHRGYAIEDLASNCKFLEVAFLLIHGKLPSLKEMAVYSKMMNRHSMIHEGMHVFFQSFPENAHPMAILSSMGVSLSSFYPEFEEEDINVDYAAIVLLSKLRTIAAFSYKKSIGEPFVYPRHDLIYVENLLNMMFSSPVNPYVIDPVIEKALNAFLILHADHEQNCSTAVVRTVGSTGANLYASIASGICALWGPLHGGANQAVMEMLETIQKDGGNVQKIIDQAKDKNTSHRLMGFGHRVYKTYDPRAKLAKHHCMTLLKHLKLEDDSLFNIALELEERAMKDDYFLERNLYPNVDFYTGLAYRAIGIPTNMFTVLFALGRLPGWIAHFKEMRTLGRSRLFRPRQLYTGETHRKFAPMSERE